MFDDITTPPCIIAVIRCKIVCFCASLLLPSSYTYKYYQNSSLQQILFITKSNNYHLIKKMFLSRIIFKYTYKAWSEIAIHHSCMAMLLTIISFLILCHHIFFYYNLLIYIVVKKLNSFSGGTKNHNNGSEMCKYKDVDIIFL